MRRVTLLLLMICALGISCSTTKKTMHSAAASVSTTENDGSSFDKAIFVQEDHEQPGIDFEYRWIRNKSLSSFYS